MSKAICDNTVYTILFQRPDVIDSAIIQCNNHNKSISSVTDEHEGKVGYYYSVRATYIGDAENSVLNEYLPGRKYILRQTGDEKEHTAITLFVEASTEEAAVDSAVDNLYDALVSYNRGRTVCNPMDIAIFYGEDLGEVKEVKDYLILSHAIGLQKSFPYGNGFGDFVFEAETTLENTNWLAENTDPYPVVTTEAIREKRHTHYRIKDKANLNYELYFSKEELREWLLDSFIK